MEIKLDVQALNALFPEGSTARLELQKVVTSEFIHKAFKPGTLTAEIEQAIEKAKAEAMTQAAKEFGLVKEAYYGGRVSYQVTPEFQAKICAEARFAFEGIRAAAVASLAADPAFTAEDLTERVLQRTTRILEENIRSTLNAELKAKLAAAISGVLEPKKEG